MKGIREFEQAQRENADHPASWMNLGNMYSSIGDVPAAEAAYRGVREIQFQGMQYRKDIGWRAIGRAVG